MIEKMTSAFQKAEGGLFSTVTKADVGDAVGQLGDVTLMAWADPFYPAPSLPAHIIKATTEAIESGFASHYTPPIGNPDLKRELAKRLALYNGLVVDPMRNILITPGSDAGLFFAMLPFISSGDEVMIVDPSYPNNFQNTEIMGGKVVRVPVKAENNYQFEIEDFRQRVTDRTKMVVLTNPNNPTTAVYRPEKLEALAEFIVEHDLVLVVDQAFEEPVFDGLEMVTMATLPNMWERTVTVFSLSKGMGLSGFRVGYLVTNEQIMDKLYGTAVSVLGATNTASQIGAITALQDSAFQKEYNAVHLKRRNLVYETLKDIPGTVLFKSESGFLSWMKVSELGSAEEIVDYLIKNAKVVVNAGTPYGDEGKGHIRIVHGVLGDDNALRESLIRIKDALTKLAQEKGLV